MPRTHADDRGLEPRSFEAGLFRTAMAASWYHATRGAAPRGLDEEDALGPSGREKKP